MRVSSVDRSRYRVFLFRAAEFLDSSREGMSRGRAQAATSSAVHAAIAAVDAVMVFHAGKRSAPQRHEDAVELLGTLGLPEAEVGPRARQLRRLLGLKTKAEYLDELVSHREAADALRAAERIVEWARSRLPRSYAGLWPNPPAAGAILRTGRFLRSFPHRGAPAQA